MSAASESLTPDLIWNLVQAAGVSRGGGSGELCVQWVARCLQRIASIRGGCSGHTNVFPGFLRLLRAGRPIRGIEAPDTDL